tara:strand:- start:52759 stop:53118 length:360 start_codon:yes stop_codon:yes gene_type:complete
VKKSKLLELLGLDKIIESLQKLLEVRIAMIREEIEETVAEKLAKILPILLVVSTMTLLVLFASLTLAFYLAEILDSYVAGFGIVALFYFLLTLVFYFLKDSKAVQERFRKEVNRPVKED